VVNPSQYPNPPQIVIPSWERGGKGKGGNTAEPMDSFISASISFEIENGCKRGRERGGERGKKKGKKKEKGIIHGTLICCKSPVPDFFRLWAS